MNRAQRIIVIVYCIAIALACFYVPCKFEFQEEGVYIGYHLIWSGFGKTKLQTSGTTTTTTTSAPLVHIDHPVVILEILGITALGAMAFTLAGAFKKKIKEDE